MRLLFSFRRWLVSGITLGMWPDLGRLMNGLADRNEEQSERIDRLTFRVDEYMRHMEVVYNVVTPSSIEPPRLTTFGEVPFTGEGFDVMAPSEVEAVQRALAIAREEAENEPGKERKAQA